MKVFRVLFFLFLTINLIHCHSDSKEISLTADVIHEWNITLEESIVNDFFPPPTAARIYAYPNIAAYEILANHEMLYSPLSNLYAEIEIPKPSKNINTEIASVYAFYFCSIELVYSIDSLNKAIEEFGLNLLKKDVSENQIAYAKAYGKLVAEAVLAWAKEDGYKAMRSYDEYTPLQQAGKWIPTPPDYSAALEPYWGTLRPFTLDSASQFKPVLPTPYSLDTASLFYKETIQVYKALNSNTEETEAIAKFWDCNPLVKKHQGHVTFAEKKLTPGGHWMNIARMAMKKQKFNLIETSHLYTLLSIGINDAFISCWDEKYRSNYIRPVTVIQEFIDPKWTPILYTPNFPEYPSGHSVVSGSAATILTDAFGESFAFTDSTEVPYGMPPRSFHSFYAASDEAAISRLYGGIHFMPAIENGKSQGRKVGHHVLQKLSSLKAR